MCMNLKQLWTRQQIENRSSVYPRSEVVSLLEDQFPGINIFTVDGKYRVLSKEDFDNVLRQNAVNSLKYVSEWFDCDKFALLFWALTAYQFRFNGVAACISYSSMHAFNVIPIERNGRLEIWKLEPQADRMWRAQDREKERYKVNGEMILL